MRVGLVALTDATNSALVLNNAQMTDAGSYTVVVANSLGSVISAGATLTVLIPPGISTDPQSQAVVAGQVTMTICDPPPASGPLRAGTARAIAITANERHHWWPDVPTLKESGADVEVWLWTAFFAPAKAPPAIVARLQQETARVVRLPDVAEGLTKLGVDPVGGSSDELKQRLARDLAKWKAVAKAANIKND